MTLAETQKVLEAFENRASQHIYNQDNSFRANVCMQFYRILLNTLADELTVCVLDEEIYEQTGDSNIVWHAR